MEKKKGKKGGCVFLSRSDLAKRKEASSTKHPKI